ncbi:telomerase reverse transcriptase-like isoform X2 [Cimex lectularius]|uniref:Telomerase reverse transcriptase n=1 Tax=Cimex lectularius TaxID=79782 RepID=A0A8I6SSG7_CIMLE|nr:telomerase reverse transcriptase-like isoform X2 [Cimex lectularius]
MLVFIHTNTFPMQAFKNKHSTKLNCRFKRQRILENMMTQKFGYNPFLVIKRDKMLHRRYAIGRIMLFAEKNRHDMLKKALKEDVGYKMKKVFVRKRIINSFAAIAALKLQVIQVKNELNKIIREVKTTYTKEEVIKFVTIIINKYIPYKILGRKKYYETFRRNCINIILANYKQNMLLSNAMKGLNKTSLKNRHLTAKIVLWLNKLLMRVIGSIFYVTEGTKCRDIIFYNPRYWIGLQKSALEDLESNGEIKQIEVLSHSDPSIGKMRLVPKPSGTGLRPLVLKSTNQQNESRLILRCNLFLKQLVATKLGAYPNAISDIHSAWLEFSTKNQHYKEKLYFVKMDIKNAYGSIIHEELKNILKLLFDECLPVDHLSVNVCSYQGIWKEVETEQFAELTQSISSHKKVSANIFKTFILDFIDNIKVNMNHTNKTYRFVKGLPQGRCFVSVVCLFLLNFLILSHNFSGSALSSVLCEIYYSYVDQQFLNFTNKEEGDLCIRLVDDYLFASRSQERAERFLSLLENGFPKYGLFIKNEKTLTNLIQDVDFVPYFGLKFNLKTKQVKPNLEGYYKVDPLSTMTIRRSFDLSTLKERLLFTHTLKLYKILLDNRFLWKTTIIWNIFDAATIMALRFSSIVKNLLNSSDKMDFYQLVDCVMSSAFKISKTAYGKLNSGTVSLECLKYCVIKAFVKVLERKAVHKKVVKKLKAIMGKYLKFLKCREMKIALYVGKKLSEPLETCL